MRLAPRIDNTHKEIVKGLRGVGAGVTSMAPLGKGVVDLLVSFRQRWYVIEVKTPGGKLTDDECEWIQKQQAQVGVAYSLEDALRWIGALA